MRLFSKSIFFIFYFSFCQTLIAQVEQLWGTTLNGGIFSQGNIFQVDTNGTNITNAHSFDNGLNGAMPCGGMFMASNQKLYGLLSMADVPTSSMIFEYDPSMQLYVPKATFDGVDGYLPRGQLQEAVSGKLYGVTSHGGTSNEGVIFEYDPMAETYTKKIDFNGTNGSTPYSGMSVASNGKFYGTTSSGGANNKGVLYEYDPILNILSVKVDFAGLANGQNPAAPPIQTANGKLYGTTRAGGINDFGTIYEYDPVSEIFVKLFDFSTSDGANPDYLVEGINGNLYGICNADGVLSYGVIFEYNILGTSFQVIHNFEGGLEGQNPHGLTVQASDSKLYGTAMTSGFSTDDVLYYFDISTSDFQVQKILNSVETGYGFIDVLQEHNNGNIYGLTVEGGTMLAGAFFEYDPSTNTYTNIHSFSPVNNNGEFPSTSVLQVDSNLVYGVTETGGSNSLGILFELNPNTNVYNKKIDFGGITNGSLPKGDLIEADNGKLYGLTSMGGINNLGVLFEYTIISGTIVKLIDFDGVLLGSIPEGGLIQASNGNLYATTKTGGLNNHGVLFEYDINTSTFTKKHDFNGPISGSFPTGNLIQAANGKLYGLTTTGGVNDLGTIFEFDPVSGILATIFEFDGAGTGAIPTGALYEAANGKLYGLTSSGGLSINGTLFEFDYVSVNYTTLIDFDGLISGAAPKGSLIETTSGKLYGVTSVGGSNNLGVLFEYDYLSSAFTNKYNFSQSVHGKNPMASLSKILVCPTANIVENVLVLEGSDYTFPDGFQTFNILTPLTHLSYFMTVGGCDSIIETHIYIGNLLHADVFALPVSSIDTCDGYAYAFAQGGVPPYSYDWFTQTNNENIDLLDSLCEGFHTLKVLDAIGDSVFVEYFVTDSSNFYEWYDASFTGYVDTIYISAPNCALDYSLPLDSAEIILFYYLSPDTIPSAELYVIGINYFQTGTPYLHLDTISLDPDGWYVIDFSVYCPIKSFNKIKTMVMAFNYPTILNLNETAFPTVLIYPNPAKDEFTIVLSDEVEATFRLFDALGNIVLTQAANKSTTINISTLAQGVYVYTLTDQTGKKATGKLVVE